MIWLEWPTEYLFYGSTTVNSASKNNNCCANKSGLPVMSISCCRWPCSQWFLSRLRNVCIIKRITRRAGAGKCWPNLMCDCDLRIHIFAKLLYSLIWESSGLYLYIWIFFVMRKPFISLSHKIHSETSTYPHMCEQQMPDIVIYYIIEQKPIIVYRSTSSDDPPSTNTTTVCLSGLDALPSRRIGVWGGWHTICVSVRSFRVGPFCWLIQLRPDNSFEWRCSSLSMWTTPKSRRKTRLWPHWLQPSPLSDESSQSVSMQII